MKWWFTIQPILRFCAEVCLFGSGLLWSNCLSAVLEVSFWDSMLSFEGFIHLSYPLIHFFGWKKWIFLWNVVKMQNFYLFWLYPHFSYYCCLVHDVFWLGKTLVLEMMVVGGTHHDVFFPIWIVFYCRGCLFYGPPGTGKTLVARALAGEYSRSDRKITFFMRSASDCMRKYVGESERQLRVLFEQVRLKCTVCSVRVETIIFCGQRF